MNHGSANIIANFRPGAYVAAMDARAPTRRFHAPDLGGSDARLSDTEAHHAIHVLRLKSGDEVELFDGRGTLARATIASVRRGCVTVRVGRRTTREPVGPAVHLAFAVPRAARMNWLLEKATELGAASLQPVVFARSTPGTASMSPAKRRRWTGHCIAAAKQCGLNFLPEIRPPAGLAEFLARGIDGPRLLGDTGEGAVSLYEALAGWPGSQIALLGGAQGGLTETERRAAVDAGFAPVRIGRTTLRIETAAIAMLAATIAIRR